MGKDRAVKFAALWVGVVTAAHFAGDMYPGFVTPLLPFFKDKFQSDYLGNSVLPVMKYAGMAMQPLFGILSDRTRRKHLIVIGVICSAIFYSVITTVPTMPLVAICIFLGGLGVSMFHPQSAALAGRLPTGETGRTMSWFVAGGQTGVAFGMVAAPFIVDRFRPGALVVMMPVGIAAGLLVLLIPASPGGRPAGERKPEHRLLRQVARAGWPFAVLTGFVILRAFVINGFCYGVPHLLYEEGRSLTWAAAPVVLFLLVGALGVIAGGRIVSVIGERALLWGSSVLGAACLGGFLMTSGWPSFLLLAAGGAALSSSTSLHIVLGQRLLPDNASAGSSVMIGVGWGAGGLLIPLIGAGADHYASMRPALAGVTIVCAATALLAVWVPTEARGGTPGTAPAERPVP